MNNAQRGLRRDRETVSLVRSLGAVTTDQVRAILFPLPTGLRKAQERLGTLFDRGELNRCRLSPNEPYVYYVGRRPGQLEHLVTVSWAYCHIRTGLSSWERLEEWRREEVLGGLRSDALAGIHIRPTDAWRFVFVEADCSDNPFDKVRLYSQVYESQAYLTAWWTERATRFPSVLVVTTDEARKREIMRRIARENVSRLRFEVRTVEEVKKGAGLNAGSSGAGRGDGVPERLLA